jgi:hypothetical protein
MIKRSLRFQTTSATFPKIPPIAIILRFVKFRAHPCFFILLLACGIMPAVADWREEIGFTRLQLLAAAELPTFPAQGLTQVEAPDNGNYSPDTANPLFTGKSFTLMPGASGVSGHATRVATNFYGSSSQIPGACGVDLYDVNNWLSGGFLETNSSIVPSIESRAVQNHSWVGSVGSTTADTEAGRRLDFAINRDGFVCVVGSDNATSSTLPQLLCQTYNTISVGRDDGGHSAGLTTLDGSSRIKPDIVAPSANPEYATSWTTPMVAGAAGLLYAKLAAAPYSLAGNDRPRVIKALLLASATKNTVPNWNNFETTPLDDIYGAGELNIYHAYSTLRTGRASASNSIQHPLRGWAAESVSSSTTQTYFFNIPAGAPSTPFSAALTWHRNVATSVSGSRWNQTRSWTSSLDNLSLRLHHASGLNLGSQIAASDSTVDNVELLYRSALVPGDYALVVKNEQSTSTPYALAWHSLPAVTLVATVSTAHEINGQAALITLTRTGDTTLPLLVPLTTSGSAISGAHFQPLPGSVTLAAGQVSTTVQVVPISDFLAQGNRTLIVAVAADFALVRDPAQTAVVTILDKPFDAWRFLNFTNSERANPAFSSETADPDGDQLANLLEYALGLAPNVPNTSPVAVSDLGGYLEISAAKNSAASDITWGAEVTGGFSDWIPAIPITDTPADFAARDSVLKNTADQRFIRLKVTRP